MIRINLLPSEDRPKQRSLRLPDKLSLGIYAAALLIIAAGGYTYLQQSHKLKGLEAKRVEQNAEEERLARQTKAIEQLEVQSALLTERLDVLRQLEAHRFENVEWLNSVNVVLPAGLWLKQLGRTTGGGKSTLEGVAEGFQPVSDLMKAMELSGQFSTVQLVKAERTMLGTRQMILFTVSAGYAGAAPPPAVTAPEPSREGKQS
jgi:Tfp pilus assembly protein PilN